jgi:hypothetical protein
MIYKLLAETILVVHFLWILFMLFGFVYNIVGLFFNKKLLKNFWLRTVHLVGILYVASLAVLDKHCPLTVIEAKLRQKFVPNFIQPDSFIIYYLEKIVYPNINAIVIIIPTVAIAASSFVIYIIKPPVKINVDRKYK